MAWYLHAARGSGYPALSLCHSGGRDAGVHPSGGAVERAGRGHVAVAIGVNQVDPDAGARGVGHTVRLDVDVRLRREPNLARFAYEVQPVSSVRKGFICEIIIKKGEYV